MLTALCCASLLRAYSLGFLFSAGPRLLKLLSSIYSKGWKWRKLSATVSFYHYDPLYFSLSVWSVHTLFRKRLPSYLFKPRVPNVSAES